MKEAVIVSGARTAVGRAPKGTLRATHPADMTAACIEEALSRAGGLDPSEVEDVIIGCAMPEGTQGYNVARQSLLRAGLPETVPGQTVNRFCSSGLQTIASAAERIIAGYANTIVSGGVEHMSTPLEMPNFSPNPTLVETNPAVYMGMGLTAEEVAKEFDVSREDQDEFALRSHDLAREAVESGRFDEEIVPMDVKLDWVNENGEPQHMETTFQRDEGPRDTSQEKLAKLPTVFRQDGTVTAGNSSQRSDGDAAFAAQALAVIREVGLDLEKTNVNGGAIALGHPMGATGTKLTVQLMSEMKRRGSKYGMVTMCIGGGTGGARGVGK